MPLVGEREDSSIHLANGPQAEEPGRPHELATEKLDDAKDAGLARSTQSERPRPAEENGTGAEGDRLRDVGAPPHPTVEKDLDLSSDLLHNAVQSGEGGPSWSPARWGVGPRRRAGMGALAARGRPILERAVRTAPRTLEGGDVFQVGGALLVGVSQRTSSEGTSATLGHLGRDVHVVELAAGALHLDTVFNVVGGLALIAEQGVKDVDEFTALLTRLGCPGPSR
jgi:hypothetical protein